MIMMYSLFFKSVSYMIFARFWHTLRSSTSISWKPTGKLQQTLASVIEKSGITLHSGALSMAKLFPAMAGEGRFFVCGDRRSIIPASIDFVAESVLCTTLCRDAARVRTVEQLLSALEATGVDNCRIAITGADEVPAIGCQWFSSVSMDDSFFVKQIASSRTFCIYEEVERLHNAGLIRGGSAENAIVCSSTKGWLNPPLRFSDEPCRHKVLDLVGDLSLFAQNGNQGLLVAHLVAYKGGHSLHAEFVRRCLSRSRYKRDELTELVHGYSG